MAKPGSKPKPTVLKRLAGNPGKRPLNLNEPKPDPADLKAPKGHLPRVGWLLWKRLARRLDRLDLLTELDRQALELMCIHYAYASKAEKVLRRQGIIAIGCMGQPVKHPAHQVFMDHSKAFLRYAAEFGMTPSSRTSLIAGGGDGGEMTLAEMLFQSVSDGRK